LSEYLYIAPRLDGIALFSSDALSETTERHKVLLDVGTVTGGVDPVREIERRTDLAGVVIGLTTGVPDRARLQIAGAVLRRGLRLWIYWPNEEAIRCVGRER